MSLKAVYESKEKVPPALLEFYEEKDGKWILQKIEGLQTSADFERINLALKKERDDHKASKLKLSVFPKEWDSEKYAQEQSELEELRIKVGDHSDDKIQALLEAQLARKLGPIERERDLLIKTSAEQLALNIELQSTINNGQLNTAIRQAASKLDMVPSAIEDAQLLGRSVLSVGDDGQILTKDGATSEAWLTSLKELKPHWYPPSVSGGAKGGGGGGGTENPWSSNSWNMTRQSAIVKEIGMEAAEKIAKQASSSVGAIKATPLSK